MVHRYPQRIDRQGDSRASAISGEGKLPRDPGSRSDGSACGSKDGERSVESRSRVDGYAARGWWIRGQAGAIGVRAPLCTKVDKKNLDQELPLRLGRVACPRTEKNGQIA